MSDVKNVFICAPYRAKTKKGIKANIAHARKMAIEIAAAGFYPVCPHLNTGLFDFEPELKQIGDEFYLEGIRNMLEGCDAIYSEPHMCTAGMKEEFKLAGRRMIPHYCSIPKLRYKFNLRRVR